jgi:hypothetical protein
MAKQTALYLPKAANNSAVTFVNADGTAYKTVFTAAADDSDLKALIVASNDTSAVNIEISVTRSAVDYVIGTVNVPIGAGMSATGAQPAVDLLNSSSMPGLPLDSAGKRYLPLKTGDTVKVRPLAAVTSTKTVYVTALGQDY